MQVFPLPPTVKYSYAQAFGSGPREHHGTDIFAPRGTPVVAVDDGMVRLEEDPKGGRVVYLTADDGTRYYYAHLGTWMPDITEVEAGEVIGTVGTSGNAKGTSPHLHFEVSAEEGGPRDPFPLLVQVDPRRRGGDDLPDLGVHALPPNPLATEQAPPEPKTSGLGIGVLIVLWLALTKKGRRCP